MDAVEAGKRIGYLLERSDPRVWRVPPGRRDAGRAGPGPVRVAVKAGNHHDRFHCYRAFGLTTSERRLLLAGGIAGPGPD